MRKPSSVSRRISRRRRGVGGPALGGERQTLLGAEAVVLVDDGEGEIAESDIGLRQHMGPDDDRQPALGEARQQPAPLFAPGQADPDAGGRRRAAAWALQVA